MNDNTRNIGDRDAVLDDFVAELTRAAYHVALRHGAAGMWLDLELDLWRALAATVKDWGWKLPPGQGPLGSADLPYEATPTQEVINVIGLANTLSCPPRRHGLD
jgi:hypothetical protein